MRLNENDQNQYGVSRRNSSGNLTEIAKDNFIVTIKNSQTLAKALHIPDFLNPEDWKDVFDYKYMKTLPYKERLRFLMNENNLPERIVKRSKCRFI